MMPLEDIDTNNGFFQFAMKYLFVNDRFIRSVLFVLSMSSLWLDPRAMDAPTLAVSLTWPSPVANFKWGTDAVADVAVDRALDLVYVLVRQNPFVRVFKTDGTFVRSWTPSNTGTVHGIHVDFSHNVWIAETDNSTVTKYSPTGVVLLVLGTKGVTGMDGTHFNKPTNVAVTKDGEHIFVGDGYGNKRVAHFRKDGSYVGMWGSDKVGRGEGQFGNPHDLVVIGESLYVADRDGGRIQVFDFNGKFIRDFRDVFIPWALAEWHGSLWSVGAKYDPGQKTSDLNLQQQPYVVPQKRENLFHLGIAGQVLDEFTLQMGTQLGQFNMLHGMDMDSSGNIYIADVGGNHIQKLTITGLPVSRRTNLSRNEQHGGLSVSGPYSSSEATFRIHLPEVKANRSLLYITDTRGVVVKQFTFKEAKRRPDLIRWDGTNSQGSILVKGIYFVYFRSGSNLSSCVIHVM